MDKIFNNLTLNKQFSNVYAEVDGLSLQNLFYTNNGYFPCCYMFSRSTREYDYYFDVDNIYKEIMEKESAETTEVIKYITRDMQTKEENMGFCIVMKDKNIYARIEKNVSECYVLFANDNDGSLTDFINLLEKNYVAPEEEKNNFYKIAQSPSGFSLKKGTIKEIKDFSIERLYNDDFPHEDEKIKKFIKDEDKSGIIILHGEKGTGKTTYIKNLISTNSDKRFVAIPPDLVKLLGTPSFTTFISSLNNHIIILEDCENVIRDRMTTGANSAVSTLLNMSDGLLADDLSIKFICTFNADIRDIDPALMRKGRLISKYEFKPLTVEKTNNLLKYVYLKKAEAKGEVDENNVEVPYVENPLTLADIFNFEDDSYETIRKKII